MNPLLIAKLVGYAVAAAFIGWGVHVYNEHIRAPLLKEITLLTDLRKADALAAQKALDQRKIENEKALQGYIDYARNSDANYDVALGKLRDHAAALKRGSPAGQAGTGNTNTPDSTPAAAAAVGEPDPVTAEIALYAAEVRLYAQSCYEFVNQK